MLAIEKKPLKAIVVQTKMKKLSKINSYLG